MKDVYRILSGAMGQELRMDQVANNLANVSTAGFKKDGATFVDFLRQQEKLAQAANGKAGDAAAGGGNSLPGQGDVWPILGSSYVDFSPGEMRQTSRDLDVALEGPGFFQVQVEGQKQPLYTRAGDFKMDQDGALRTMAGHAVLDASGSPIKLNPTGGGIGISPKGEIRQGGATVATLGVVEFAQPQQLLKFGDSLLSAPQGVAGQPVQTPSVRQGMLEGSNVNAVDEMVKMIQLERHYNTMQKAIQSVEDATAKRIDAANN